MWSFLCQNPAAAELDELKILGAAQDGTGPSDLRLERRRTHPCSNATSDVHWTYRGEETP